jgi:RNA polymerase sigma factor (sigma-70 family)
MAMPATGIEANHRLDELYRAHASDIYRYVYAVLGNRADAEDVMQTTFVNALRALERGEVPRKPENWLITIAHNLIRQRFRQQSLRPRQVELDGEIPTLEADDNGPSIDDLVRALQRIPETQREALVLRELDGRSYKEIAAILDISVSALQTLLFRARRSLAEELENLVTCDRAELALSQDADGRLGRKERRRLAAHLKECPSCTRVAAVAMKRRRAFKGLALLPLPWSLTFFKGAPSASAAVGLPTIGGTAAAGGTVVGGGIAVKVAIGFAAVAVAGGAGYEGVKVMSEPAAPAKAAPVTPKADSAPTVVVRRTPTVAPTGKPAAKKPLPVQAAAAKSANGRSATAPGHTKPKTAPKANPNAGPKPKTNAPQNTKPKKQKPVQAVAPKAAPGAAKSEAAKSKPAPAPKPKKDLVPAAELPEPPALPRGPQDDQVLPEVARDRLQGPRP